ncbi:Piso0_005340 [Millerozyma farinosa CBS 7064]|uniref:Piso0_005340 protein n=1 Tax=Pichia sorbitophila (strain ATCC MYA-4447 / BCRC 22081 / CBS 7064 / NBRC 10061 / NRRL Y-12695) TaxID=559304 RepID=G8Y1X3_PICSO|nr:Piso0_005340 [Millerozyma farinosa CBS 7064]
MVLKSSFMTVAYNRYDSNSTWVYLADWILALLLALAFVFHFGRLVAFIISLILRFTIWQRYKIRINIESLRISLLGGRLFAKNLTIITADYTISIIQLNFTWRYWLLGITRLPEYILERAVHHINTSKKENSTLPSRFLLTLEGCEIFVYNRTAAYYNIIDTLEKQEKSEGKSTDTRTPSPENDTIYQKMRYRHSNQSKEKSSCSSSESETTTKESYNNFQNNAALFFLLRFLPIDIRIKKGAVVIGNVTTPSILVLSYMSGQGSIDITKSKSEYDNYKLINSMSMENFQISLKHNFGYDKGRYFEHEAHKAAPGIRNTKGRADHKKKYRQWFRMIKAMNIVSEKAKTAVGRLYRKKDKDAYLSEVQWKGLRRYLGNAAEDKELLENLTIDEEYAKYSILLDSKRTKLAYFYDAPGFTPSGDTSLTSSAPEFGVDIDLFSATIHYGPWADRRRSHLQTMFFPSLARDAQVTKNHNAPGHIRCYDGFNINLNVLDELIFRVPTREPSKHTNELSNTKPKSKDGQQKEMTRPFGWIELNIKKGSHINYFAPYITSEDDGWLNRLDMDMIQPELRSSVNHDIMFTADHHAVHCKLAYPLEWNGECNWFFNNYSENARIFFLREHTILLSDMFTDFSAGTAVPYEFLRAFTYNINWKFSGCKLYLNVNDQNIINNPLDFNSNKYLSIQGDDFDCQFVIPLYGNLRKSNTISYNITSPLTKLILDCPPWHTANSFMKSNVIGKCQNFTIKGSYTYFSQVEVNASNYIVINVFGDYTTLKFYGFVVKYFFVIRENYVGDNLHFKTFEEYTKDLDETIRSERDYSSDNSAQSSLKSNENGKKPTNELDRTKHFKTENDVDIFFSYQVRHGLLLLPYNLYETSSHLGLRFDSFDLDIRFTNYYSDIQSSFSPIKVVFHHSDNDVHETDLTFDIPEYTKNVIENNEDMTIDGFTIHSHRMFGLPPKEITYYSKWDFATEGINIDSTAFFLCAFVKCLTTFGFGYKDLENSLNIEIPKIPNAGNFAFRCPSIDIALRPTKSKPSTCVLAMNLESVLLCFNDIANDRYSDRLSVMLSSISLSVKDEISQIELSSLSTNSIYLDGFIRADNFHDSIRSQREFIAINDAPFHRCPFIIPEDLKDSKYMEAYGSYLTTLTLLDASYPLTKLSYYKNDSQESFELYSSSEGSKEELTEDGKFLPTVFYEDEDFYPVSDYDPKFAHLAVVADLGEVNVRVTPAGISFLCDLAESSVNFSVANLIDNLQIDVVQELNKKLIWPCAIHSFRLIASVINFKICENHAREPEDKLSPAKQVEVCIEEPSVVLRATVDRKKGDRFEEEIESNTKALHVKGIHVNVVNLEDHVSPLRFIVNDVEYWDDMAKGFNISSVSLDTVELQAVSEYTKWGISFVLDLLEHLIPLYWRLADLKKSSSKILSDFVYSVSSAGNQFYIGYDPGVLTKPSYFLRSSKQHVRFFDSWKIVVRLRHIISNMPKSWIHTQDERYKKFQWDDSPEKYEAVLGIFSQWRNWEANESERIDFFKSIFEDKTANYFKTFFQASLRSFSMDIQGGKEHDIASMEDFSLLYNDNESKENESSASEIQIKNKDFYVSILTIESKLSTISLEVVKEILDGVCILNEQEGGPHRKTEDDFISIYNQILININYFDVKLELPLSSTRLRLDDTALSSQVKERKESKKVTVMLQSSFIQFQVLDELTTLVDYTSKDIDFLFSDVNTYSIKTHLFSIHSDSQSLQIGNKKSSNLDNFWKVIDEDVPLLLSYTPKCATDSTGDSKNQDLWKLLSDSTVEIQFNTIEISCYLLHPLAVIVKVSDGYSKWMYFQNKAFIESFVQNFEVYSILNGRNFMDFMSSQILTNLTLREYDSLWAVNASSSLSSTKMAIPSITTSLKMFLSEYTVLNSNIQKLSSLIKNRTSDTQEPRKESPGKQIAFKSKIANDYFVISSFVDNSKLSFEIDNISFGAYNVGGFDNGELKTHELVPLYGDLTIPSLRLSLIDGMVPNDLSTILDLNLGIRVFNDDTKKNELQTLNIESQHFRICTSPQVVIKSLHIIESLKRIVASASPLNVVKGKEEKQPADTAVNGSKSKFYFSTINVLSYNFCMGWLYGGREKTYPGIILGAERFFAVIEENIGKFTLLDFYFAVAKGNTSSNFFRITSEEELLNYASLPNMQILYTMETLESSKKMRINAYGDELDVRFVSDSVILLEKTFESVSEVQSHFHNKAVVVEEHKQTEGIDYFKILESKYSSVECSAKFAGSNLVFYNSKDLGGVKESTPLFLHSPAVQVAALYKRQRGDRLKHIFRCEILTSPSNNILYSSCVPVVLDFVQGIKTMMHKSGSKIEPRGEVEDANSRSAATSGKTSNIGGLLKDVDLHIGLNIKEQKISLSCEPTAKVETAMGIKGIQVHINTMNREVPNIVVTSRVEKVSASLQHIYSRDVSGFVSIDNIILMSSATFDDMTILSSSGYIDNVQAFINVKQFQDLNLFKDIWFPKKYRNTWMHGSSMRSRASKGKGDVYSLISNKSLANRSKEVSSTSTLPWAVTFMIYNINLSVDFGQSLGKVGFYVDRLWALSSKNMDWSQSLKLNMNTVSLKSEGRLGGDISVKDVYLHTAISWKLKNNVTLDIPLLIVSAGLGSVKLKLSFDYHVFIIGIMRGFSVDIYNQKNEQSISKDYLFGEIQMSSLDIFTTSLAASNILDIYNTIVRMVQENRRSYKETLNDSTRSTRPGSRNGANSKTTTDKKLFETVKKLETKIKVKVSHINIFVYPSTFADSKALILRLDESKIRFQEGTYEFGMSSQLDVWFNDIKVSLSMVNAASEDFILRSEIEEFKNHVSSAVGGTIFVFPSFKISMRTFQPFGSNVIEYLYRSSFGGTVDIRWNLGSVNFIREMYSIHKQGLDSRKTIRRRMSIQGDKLLSPMPASSKSEDSNLIGTHDTDLSLSDENSKPFKESMFIYKPLVPPLIQAPQLKELGNATPPLEWFGLYRNKFPDVTHEYGIVNLQKIIQEVETQYYKTLGKA